MSIDQDADPFDRRSGHDGESPAKISGMDAARSSLNPSRATRLRDRRARMLAVPPRWRATDARVDPRVAVGSILAMWAAYFLITAFLAWLGGLGDLWGQAGRRALVVTVGASCTFLLYLLLRRIQPQGFGARMAWAFGTAVPLTIIYAVVNLLTFFYWFPSHDSVSIMASVQAKYPSSWQLVLILDSAIRWYFFFALWASLYVALGYANEMRAVERRADTYRLEAKTAQLRALHYQVNPHFLFNTLNSLSTLVMRGSVGEAEQMIMNLSAFLRSSIATDPEQLIPLADEVALQRVYLDIEQLRFPSRLAVHVDLAPGADAVRVPALILQPIIENAIKYGVSPSKGSIGIRLAATIEHGMLVGRIENDIDRAAPRPASGTGLGLANVRDRLLTRFGSAAGCEWGTRDDGALFIVTIWMPARAGLDLLEESE